MYLIGVIISACAILCCLDAAELRLTLDSDHQYENTGVTDNISTGKHAVPFTPLPETETREYPGNYNVLFGQRPSQNKRCPLCDSSVYPYCGENLLHDACCCTDPYVHDLPYQCKLADCRFLHANSCREHRLIANCCCNDDYRSLLKSFLIV